MSKLRIAHVISTPSGIGGAEIVVRALASRGVREGIEQVVLNPFARKGEQSALSKSIASTEFFAYPCEHYWEMPAARSWLGERLRLARPHVVHTHLFHAEALVASLPRAPGTIRLLTHHHGDLFRVEKRRREQWIDKRAGRFFDRIVAVSSDVKRFLVERYRYDPNKIVVIHNGWTGEPRERSRSSGRKSIACVANLRPQKGHTVLLRAMAIVCKRFPEADLFLAGDGPLLASLQEEVRRLGLSGKVHFLGRVEDVWPLLAETDVFALPSLSEPLGIAVMEAMAAGVPVVASAVGGVLEIVKDGVSGRLVPPNDAATLASSLIGLLEDPQLRSSMGLAGRSVADGYKIDRMLDSYFELYDELSIRSDS
jgi:glycosyltransferase involved in cell wall biosynthesis